MSPRVKWTKATTHEHAKAMGYLLVVRVSSCRGPSAGWDWSVTAPGRAVPFVTGLGERLRMAKLKALRAATLDALHELATLIRKASPATPGRLAPDGDYYARCEACDHPIYKRGDEPWDHVEGHATHEAQPARREVQHGG